MARLARIAVVNVPHHVTQRGNARQFILSCDSERSVYLELLRNYIRLYDLSLLGFCLMSSHVHLVVIPKKNEALALALKHTHGRYATYWNALHRSSGHVWQGRFYSCPLDHDHLWIAMRYAELNPVRAGMVSEAALWPWSSAAVHCGGTGASDVLEVDGWEKRRSAASWREYLAGGETKSAVEQIRRCTHTGRPLGSAEFVQSLEETTQRRLAAQKGGRPAGSRDNRGQALLEFKT